MSKEMVETEGPKHASALEAKVVAALRRAADQALRRAKSDMPTRVQFIEDCAALESAFREKHAAVWEQG